MKNEDSKYALVSYVDLSKDKELIQQYKIDLLSMQILAHCDGNSNWNPIKKRVAGCVARNGVPDPKYEGLLNLPDKEAYEPGRLLKDNFLVFYLGNITGLEEEIEAGLINWRAPIRRKKTRREDSFFNYDQDYGLKSRYVSSIETIMENLVPSVMVEIGTICSPEKIISIESMFRKT